LQPRTGDSLYRSKQKIKGFNGQGQNGAFGEIIQDGIDNSASMNQRAWGSDGNEHSIEQLGEANVANVDIYNGNNFGFVVQEGSENSARMVQSGTGNGSVILQTGEENYATSSSTAGSGNITGIVQGVPGGLPQINGPQQLGQVPLIPILPSAGNTATLGVKGSNNVAGILQLGLFNNAGSNPSWTGDLGISIEGDGNTAGIAQLGIENAANISVLGNSNMALIGQMGSSNTGSIMQDGSGNSAVISQSGMGLGPVLD
jgi:hypothetical protein